MRVTRKMALFQSRMHSVGKIVSKITDRKRKTKTECIQSKKACYEAAIPSEAKPTSQQEEKEQAEERVER
jgi:hypothetical protein